MREKEVIFGYTKKKETFSYLVRLDFEGNKEEIDVSSVGFLQSLSQLSQNSLYLVAGSK